MYDNPPFGGNDNAPAHQSSATETATLSASEKQTFRKSISQIEGAIARHLPEVYVTSHTVTQTPQGIQGIITIQPPIGQPIGTNLSPPTADGEYIPVDDYSNIVNDVVATVVVETMKRTNGNPPQQAR